MSSKRELSLGCIVATALVFHAHRPVVYLDPSLNAWFLLRPIRYMMDCSISLVKKLSSEDWVSLCKVSNTVCSRASNNRASLITRQRWRITKPWGDLRGSRNLVSQGHPCYVNWRSSFGGYNWNIYENAPYLGVWGIDICGCIWPKLDHCIEKLFSKRKPRRFGYIRGRGIDNKKRIRKACPSDRYEKFFSFGLWLILNWSTCERHHCLSNTVAIVYVLLILTFSPERTFGSWANDI